MWNKPASREERLLVVRLSKPRKQRRFRLTPIADELEAAPRSHRRSAPATHRPARSSSLQEAMSVGRTNEANSGLLRSHPQGRLTDRVDEPADRLTLDARPNAHDPTPWAQVAVLLGTIGFPDRRFHRRAVTPRAALAAGLVRSVRSKALRPPRHGCMKIVAEAILPRFRKRHFTPVSFSLSMQQPRGWVAAAAASA